ncbi:hypothetical protein D3C78_1246620 [compost metagenome]
MAPTIQYIQGIKNSATISNGKAPTIVNSLSSDCDRTMVSDITAAKAVTERVKGLWSFVLVSCDRQETMIKIVIAVLTKRLVSHKIIKMGSNVSKKEPFLMNRINSISG